MTGSVIEKKNYSSVFKYEFSVKTCQYSFHYFRCINNMIAFLDVLVINCSGTIDTIVYQKPTNTDIYMNWNSFAPENWKKSTLKMLIKCAYTICSQEYLLETELQHLERVFIEINGYPSEVVRRIMQQVKRKNRKTNTEVANIEPTTERPKETLVILPYAGVESEKIGKEINSVMKTVFQDKVVTKIAFKAKKLNTCFNI